MNKDLVMKYVKQNTVYFVLHIKELIKVSS